MKIVHYTAKVLILAGAVNWGLIGFFNFDLIGKILGSEDMMQMDMMSGLTRLVYCLVGVASLYGIWRFVAKCCGCSCCGSCGSCGKSGSCHCSGKK